jgi:hypothetical protein
VTQRRHPAQQASGALPVRLGDVDPEVLPVALPDHADWPWGRRALQVPRPRAVLAAAAVLLLAGLAAWGVGAAHPGGHRSSLGSATSTRLASPTGPASASVAPALPGGPTDARAGAVPIEMVGGWRGTVQQGPVSFDVTLDIRGGAVGTNVGVSRSSEGCAADLLLRETGVSTIIVEEVITQANMLCIGAVRLQLTVNDDGTLGYFYDATLINSAGLATLTRTTQPPPTFAVTTAATEGG